MISDLALLLVVLRLTGRHCNQKVNKYDRLVEIPAGIAIRRLINMTDWLRYQHVLVLYAFSTGAILKGLTPRNVMCNVGVRTVCFGLYLCRD